MLEIKLTRAMEPEEMSERPCGMCGADFRPDAVLANLATPHEYAPMCGVCLKHLAARAEEEPIPADWDEVYRRYVKAASEYRGPVFPSGEALEEEGRCPPGWGLVAPEL